MLVIKKTYIKLLEIKNARSGKNRWDTTEQQQQQQQQTSELGRHNNKTTQNKTEGKKRNNNNNKRIVHQWDVTQLRLPNTCVSGVPWKKGERSREDTWRTNGCWRMRATTTTEKDNLGSNYENWSCTSILTAIPILGKHTKINKKYQHIRFYRKDI